MDIMNKFLTNHYLNHWMVLMMDVCLSLISSALASLLALRYLGGGLSGTSPMLFQILVYSLCVSALCFILFRTHYNIIRHSSLKGLWSIGAAVLVKSVAMFVLLQVVPGISMGNNCVWFCVILDLSFTAVLLVGIRVLMLLVYDWMILHYGSNAKHELQAMQVLIYGISDKSVALKLRLHKSPHYKVVGFVKYGNDLRSYRVSDLNVYYFETGEDLKSVLAKSGAEAILFALPDDVLNERERLIPYCSDKKIKILIAPQVNVLDSSAKKKADIRNICIEDLLGREEIKINSNEVYENFHDKVVLVTGGAGSIGSEICRQMANMHVRKLIVFDNAETPLHEIRLELEHDYPQCDFVPFIGDVRDERHVQAVFEQYRPQVVFHAAAYKHVPLMESHPCEAVKVNVMGTKNVADACVRYGIEKMVMISTDKAVNPTNVMGCSKRLAEIYCQTLGYAIARGNVEGTTKFITTRFGNVLGSNGSVIPHFRKQIEAGGPITVTHPDIIRFFMTIPEACRLVMEAAIMGNGNEIFVFDMGASVKIVDLATNMIKLAGLEPGKDIKIEFTGLRPGEKLYEEVLSSEENTIPTRHKKIKIAKVREYELDDVSRQIDELDGTASANDVHETVKRMKLLVPEFVSNNSVFEQIDHELVATGERERASGTLN